MRKQLKQEKSDEKLMNYSTRIIEILSDLNYLDRYKVLSSLIDSLIEIIDEAGYEIVEND